MRRVGLLAIVLSITGCFDEDLSGSLHSRGGDLGDWDLYPEVCYSGEPEGFLGVDIGTEDFAYSVRYVQDPAQGPIVVAFLPMSSQRRLFYPEDCFDFEVYLKRTNEYIDDIELLDGFIDVHCETEAGSLEGRIEFEGCH